MAKLFLTNVDSAASDEEIKEFLMRYGFPPFDAIEHVPGDGSNPAVLLNFKDAPPGVLDTMQQRIQDLFWKNRRIHAVVIHQIP